jgi:hypothetical protein
VLTIFCLASGRSGTHFLYQLFRRNAVDCVCRHEPYGWNPSMFGRPIYDRAVGDMANVRRLAQRKARIIARSRQSTYVETSHAFLKSWCDLAPELLDNLRFVRLVRDPLKVAKSEAYRHELLDWLHVPLRNCRGGDGRNYPRWALTGLEPIYQSVADRRLTLFQRYIIQWIEIENRAMQFLDRFGKHADCFTLDSPRELNDPQRAGELFDFLGLKMRRPQIDFGGWQNRNPRRTEIADAEQREFAEVTAALPAGYRAIFRRESYTKFSWIRSDLLR